MKPTFFLGFCCGAALGAVIVAGAVIIQIASTR